MIKYNLRCENDHEFESWFRSSSDYDDQVASNHVTCPYCNSVSIDKALMAPNVSTSKSKAKPVEAVHNQKLDQDVRKTLQKVRDYIVQNSEYVGDRFAEETRQIHNDESEKSIYGEATPQEVSDLVEDGVDVLPLPRDMKKDN